MKTTADNRERERRFGLAGKLLFRNPFDGELPEKTFFRAILPSLINSNFPIESSVITTATREILGESESVENAQRIRNLTVTLLALSPEKVVHIFTVAERCKAEKGTEWASAVILYGSLIGLFEGMCFLPWEAGKQGAVSRPRPEIVLAGIFRNALGETRLPPMPPQLSGELSNAVGEFFQNALAGVFAGFIARFQPTTPTRIDHGAPTDLESQIHGELFHKLLSTGLVSGADVIALATENLQRRLTDSPGDNALPIAQLVRAGMSETNKSCSHTTGVQPFNMV